MLNSTDASLVNAAHLNQISFCDVKVKLKKCYDSSLLWNGMFSGKHISFFYFNFGNAFSVFHSWQTHIVVADIRGKTIQDLLPTLLFLRLPLCCFCDPLCCFCGPLCWNVFPFCWFGDPFCCFWSAKWECVFPKCHPPSRMLILYLSRINNSGPSKAKNQQFLSNKTESTNCADQSLVGSFQACRW